MNSTLQRMLGLIREYPLLLLGPMLGAATINFIVYRIVSYFRDLYFPEIDSEAMAAMRHAARVNGGSAVSALSSALHHTVARGAIVFGTQVFQLLLELFAIALTVAMAAHLYRCGADTFTGAVGRLRTVPRLFGSLVRLALRILFAGIGVVLTMAIVGGVLLLVFGVHQVPSAPLHGWFWLPGVSVLSFVLLGVVASLVMPYFLYVSFQIQQQTWPNDSVRARLTTHATRFAWVAAGVHACLGLLAGGANVALAGTAVLTNNFLQGIERLVVVIVEEIPVIAVVVAVALLVASANEPGY
jgi:hypothetical protein